MSPQAVDELIKPLTDQIKTDATRKAVTAMIDKVLIQYDPFILIEDGYLMIKTKAAKLERFVPNKSQRRVLNKIKAQWESGKIIRIIVLKARQLGISTLIEAVIYVLTSQKSNINSLIISDDKDGANYIFEMSKLYHEQMHPLFKTKEKKSNEKKLEFAGIHSQIVIDTAANPEAGRGSTMQLVHLSEYAFFKKVKDLMLGLSQAVPALPQTMIIKETTANGFNFFKDEWDAAINGESDYIPVFIPWFWGEDYRMSVNDDFMIADPALGELTADELSLADLMRKEEIDFIEERLNWRRWCIRNNCDGKVSSFRQEYPSTDYEAFVASGDTYFDKPQLISMIDRLPNVKSFRADIVEFNEKFELRKSPDGLFTFYYEPEPDGKYLGSYSLAGDASSGSGADFAFLEIMNQADGRQMATYHGKLDTDELEQAAYLLGNYFNQALIAIENDKFGFAVNQGLRKRYGNLYRQEIVNTVDGGVNTKFGWDTNSSTRPMMISALAEDIRQGAKEINYKKAIMECFTFVRNPETKKVEAEEGCNDDCVMSMAINSALRRIRPYEAPMTSQFDYDGRSETKPNRGFGWKAK